MPVELPQKAKGERPTYFADRSIDNILSITLALAGEVAVMRERLDSVERLLEGGEAVTREKVDSFQPSPSAVEERDAWRAHFLDVILRSVQQELEGMQEAAEKGSYGRQVSYVEAN